MIDFSSKRYIVSSGHTCFGINRRNTKRMLKMGIELTTLDMKSSAFISELTAQKLKLEKNKVYPNGV